jgi:hypothetical protein
MLSSEHHKVSINPLTQYLKPIFKGFAVCALAGLAAFPALADSVSNPSDAQPPTAKPQKKNYSFTEAMGKSIWGDVYAHPEDWQALGYGKRSPPCRLFSITGAP